MVLVVVMMIVLNDDSVGGDGIAVVGAVIVVGLR